MALGDFRPVQPIASGDIVLMLVGSGAAVSEGELVNTATGVVICGDANTAGAVGVVMATTAASGMAPVALRGIFEGTAGSGVDFAPGAVCYTGASGVLDAGTANDVSVGMVCNTNPASAGTVQFILQSSVFTATTAS